MCQLHQMYRLDQGSYLEKLNVSEVQCVTTDVFILQGKL